MATAADAELILKLYEMRREETILKGRRFLVFEFQPKTFEELRADLSRSSLNFLTKILVQMRALYGEIANESMV